MSINLPVTLLTEMVVFVKVVEAGSFSAAARQLGSSPSAVSRSIARLEKALAIRLLQRTTRKLRLSDAGEEDYSEAALNARGIYILRNDPCPCGSGLKYKQCHGRLA